MSHLQNQLREFSRKYPERSGLVEDFLDFLNAPNEKPFSRENLRRHFTASAWILNPDYTKALLTHHRKLNIWIQLGGHADGNPNLLESAIREAEEESGISGIVPINTEIFDLDKHSIPARQNEPEHYHYDIRFLLLAPHEKFSVSAESKNLAWLKFDDPFFKTEADPSVQRMQKKWLQLFNSSFEIKSPNIDVAR